MKNIVLYAPPAAGKGTQCEFLEKTYGYKVISIGQVLRNNRSMDTEIGRAIIESQDKGELTPDNIVFGALKNELEKYGKDNIVIEGFPRNIDQARLLDELVDNYIVINLDLNREVAMKRSLGRLNCNNCGHIHNIYFENMKPVKEGICNNCGSPLNVRSDDNEESFNKRFDVYEENKDSILNYYKDKDILFVVDSNRDKDEISSDIAQIIK